MFEEVLKYILLGCVIKKEFAENFNMVFKQLILTYVYFIGHKRGGFLIF